MWTIADCGQVTNAWNDPGCRNGNTIRHDVEASRIIHDANRFQQVIEIQKRLARTHANQVSSARRWHAGAISVVKREDNLLDNFARSEISKQSKLRRQTESALQRTT